MIVSRREKGFTLIELMIVITIIAILATILIVQWVGARQAAADSETLSVARNVGLATYMYFMSGGERDELNREALAEIEPSLAEGASGVEIYIDTQGDTLTIIVGPNPPGEARYHLTQDGIEPYYD